MTIPLSHSQAETLLLFLHVLTGKDKVDFRIWFEVTDKREGSTSTRSTAGTINVRRNEGRLDLRKQCWSVRVSGDWNSLPSIVKEQPTTGINLVPLLLLFRTNNHLSKSARVDQYNFGLSSYFIHA